MVAALPGDCDVGAMRRASRSPGRATSCTTASLQDSQAAIVLSRLSTGRATCLHELKDAACDNDEIGFHAFLQDHVAITDVNPRRDTQLNEHRARKAWAQRCASDVEPQMLRTNDRSSMEQVNDLLKDACGGRHVRVRDHAKVTAHLMFGVVVLTVDQLMRLTI